MCAASRRPLVCLGGGAVWADSLEHFRKFLERKNVPYVTTLMGAQWVTRNDLYYGMLGTYGRRSANWAVQNCDLLIAIGSRLDVRQTGAFADDFARAAKIVQVDIDPSQLNNRVSVDLSILSDAEKFITSVIARDPTFGSTEEWTRGAGGDEEETGVRRVHPFRADPQSILPDDQRTVLGREHRLCLRCRKPPDVDRLPAGPG